MVVVAGCGNDEGGGGEQQPATGGQPSVPPLTVAIATAQSDLLTYLAQAQGYFEEENVEVTIQSDTQANTTPLVVAGQADIGAFATTGPLAAAQQGADTSVIYATGAGGLGGTTVGDGESVRSVEDLRGLSDCRIGTFPQGTSSFGYGQLYVDRLDLQCELVPLQSAAAEVGALASGRVNAIVGGYAFFVETIAERNAPVIINTLEEQDRQRYIGEPFLEVAYWGVSSNLEDKRESVVRYLRAIDRARQLLTSASVEELTPIVSQIEEFSQFPPDQLQAVIQSFKTYTPLAGRNGFIDQPQWTFATERYTLFGIPGYDSESPEVSYEQRIDMSYFTEALGEPPAE